jgi:hypothetical protein
MKIIAALLTLFMANSAFANELDFKTMLCAKYDQKIHEASSNPENEKFVDMIHVWLFAYASGKKNSTKLSDIAIRKFVMSLADECHADPNKPLSDAAVSAFESFTGEA